MNSPAKAEPTSTQMSIQERIQNEMQNSVHDLVEFGTGKKLEDEESKVEGLSMLMSECDEIISIVTKFKTDYELVHFSRGRDNSAANVREFDNGRVSIKDMLLLATLEIKSDNTYKVVMKILRIKRMQEFMLDLKFRLKQMRGINNTLLPSVARRLTDLEKGEALLESKLQELKESNAEAHTMYHAMELVQYKKLLQAGGIVETPSVHEGRVRVEDMMRRGKPVLLTGAPGTGKTEVLKYIASRMAKSITRDENGRKITKSKSPTCYVLSARKNLDDNEIYGSRTVEASVMTDDVGREVMREVESEINKYKEELKVRYKASKSEVEFDQANLDSAIEREYAAEIRRKYDLVKDIAFKKLESGVKTSFNYGPLYKAAEEGVPFIVDECNLLIPGLLMGMNDILASKTPWTGTEEEWDMLSPQAREKYEIVTQQNGGVRKRINKGFSICFTANVGPNFQDRARLEASFKDRQGLIMDWDYLPNSSDATKTNKEEAADSESWQVMLTMLMDNKCRMQMPSSDVSDLWRMTQAIRKAQDIFSGRDKTFTFIDRSNGAPHDADTGILSQAIQDSPISMRTIQNIINDYKEGNFKYKLEKSILEKFLLEKTEDRDSIISREVYFEIFKAYGFFKDSKDQSMTYGDVETNDLFVQNKYKLRESKYVRENVDIKIFTSREVVDLAFGGEAPPIRDLEAKRIEDRYKEKITPEAALDIERARLEAELKLLEEERKRSIELAKEEILLELNIKMGEIMAKQEELKRNIKVLEDEIKAGRKIKLVSGKAERDMTLSDVSTIEQKIDKLTKEVEVLTLSKVTPNDLPDLVDLDEYKSKALVVLNSIEVKQKVIEREVPAPLNMLTKEKLTQIMQGIETTMTSIYPTWPKGKGSQLHPKDYNNTELLKKNANKFGEYSLNPETLLLPFVKMNPEIKDITTEKWYTDLNDKSRANVTKEILKHYGDKYYLPGLEYFKYLSGLDKDKVPLEFQDTTKWFFFLGSTFRVSVGGASFPALGWLGSGFVQDRFWLAFDWDARSRVVLLPRH